MPRYRMTVRIGQPGRHYDLQDIDAATLHDALRLALEHFPKGAERADLLEIRLQVDSAERAYTPG